MTFYIKPMTWAGETRFYLGTTPSDPTLGRCSRLGSYFLICPTIFQARAVAESQARKCGGDVVECDHYVGF
jgi:hypothetical protein